MAFTLASEPFEPTTILVDENNSFVRYLNEKQGQTVEDTENGVGDK
ncbi:MAG: hypothetical protein HKO06_09415 [Pseudomonadales bacterium]|nr:hypothetical protein [Pseudomonadales bacterium]